MPRAVLTSKGQMTVPHEVRAALSLEMGDQLLIETTENGFQATVVRRPTAASLQGALQGALKGSVKYVGQEAERLAVAAALAEKLRR